MGNMKEALNNAAGGAIGQIVGAGLGLALQKHNDRRQLAQNEKLLGQQLKFDADKMRMQKDLELQMWKDTNYAAQKEQMEIAGINPGLMYGMGGGGGTTTGSGASGVSGANAPVGGQEILGMMMQKAQLELIEAQAKKTNVEAEKIGGVDTEEAKSRILNLTQDVKNKVAVETLTKIQTSISNLELNLKEDSYEDVLRQIEYTADKSKEELQILKYQRELDGKTLQTKVDTINAELIGIGIENELKKSGIAVNEQQVKTMKANIAQGWQKLSIEAKNAISQRMQAEASKSNANTNLRTFFQNVNEWEIDHRLKQEIFNWEKGMNDVSESEKITVEMFTKVLQAVGIGSALGGRTQIKGFRGY